MYKESKREYNDGMKRTRSRSPSPNDSRHKRSKPDDHYRGGGRGHDDRRDLNRRRDDRPRERERYSSGYRRDGPDGDRRHYDRQDDYPANGKVVPAPKSKVPPKEVEEDDEEAYLAKLQAQLAETDEDAEAAKEKERQERLKRFAAISSQLKEPEPVQSGPSASSAAAEKGEDAMVVDLEAPDDSALPTNQQIEARRATVKPKEEHKMLDLFDPTTFEEDPDALEGKRKVELKLVVREADPSDDKEGYYSFRIGELLNKRYQVMGFHGQGVFSNVLKAQDLETKAEVAIKLLRSHDLMKQAGRKEMRILRTLSDGDADAKYNVIRMLNSFEDRQHLCLVLEPMDLNLRQIIKKYGNNVGLSIRAVRFYCFKLLKALTLLRKLQIVHADIKPDNILVNSDRTVCKLGDLGSAFEANETVEQTYLVSRFYRAPEIILGGELAYPLDMFSLGACLYELATGTYLLPSRSNNHHLKLIMEVKGMPPKKLLAHCKNRDRHFDADGNFLEHVEVVKGKDIVKRVFIDKPTRNIQSEIAKSYGDALRTAEEKKQVGLLADLIDQCLNLDPKKRITPEQAIKHPLFA